MSDPLATDSSAVRAEEARVTAERTAAARTAQGRVVGRRYVIHRLVACDTFAAVYIAHDLRAGGLVAVKLPHGVGTDTANLLRQFEREIEVGAAVSHPNLVALVDHETLDDRPYLVMEYVHGVTFAHLTDGGAPYPPEESLDLIIQVEHGLQALHQSGWIHRDVQPPNVLLSDAGHVAIANFGLATPVADAVVPASAPPLSTDPHMAPEVAAGQPFDRRGDIFSLGLTLLEPSSSSAHAGN